MIEPAPDQPVDAEPEVEVEPIGPTEVNCRHCGVPSEVDVEKTPDWLCTACEHYQDAMPCPTCGSVVRISLMPAEMAPEVHAPVKRRKAKE